VRCTADLHLLEDSDDDLLREVTGLEPEAVGRHVLLDEGLGTKSTQRLALGRVGAGIAVFTWPGELVSQSRFLYHDGRGHRLLEAAAANGWEVDPRPHLAFRNSSPPQRLYMNSILTPQEYVAGWSGSDGARIGLHERDTVRNGLWPWLRARGYASEVEDEELEPFLARLGRRPAHLRPGLRLLRRWSAADVAVHRETGQMALEIRRAVNGLLVAVGDSPIRP